jgi:hypothetical protein
MRKLLTIGLVMATPLMLMACGEKAAEPEAAATTENVVDEAMAPSNEAMAPEAAMGNATEGAANEMGNAAEAGDAAQGGGVDK